MKPIQQSFRLKEDYYNAVHIHINNPVDYNPLKECIENILTQNRKAIWVYLSQKNLNHLGLLCNQMNFKIHHGIDKNIVLYRWISQLSDLVPPYSMFLISCGAIVIKDDYILVVQENNGARKGQFGIPGGRADFGQQLSRCAERQLFQQTGIKGQYQYILYFRELENTVFGAMDIYFGCVVECSQESLSNIKLDQRQLGSYKWVHLSQLSDFMTEKSKGTQTYLANYITKLYKEGFKFKQSKPNLTNEILSTSIRDNVTRAIVEHMLIQNLSKDKQN